MPESESRGEWRQGWPLVTAGVVGMMVISLHFGPLAVLMIPIETAMGWSRSEISAGMMFIMIAQLLLGSAVGAAILRQGMRKVALTGAIVYAVGFASLIFATDLWWWYGGWALLAIGALGLSPLVWTTGITRVFERRRGIAIAIALSGTGISGSITTLLCAHVLELWGWRAALASVSALPPLGLLALYWLMGTRREFTMTVAPAARLGISGQTVSMGQMIRQVRVWQLALIGLLVTLPCGMIAVHLQSIFRGFGVSAAQAVIYGTIIGPTMIVGRLAGGVLLDYLPTRLIAAVLFGLPAVASAMMLQFDGSLVMGTAIAIVFGFAYGAENDVLAYLTSRHFTGPSYPLAYSIVYTAITVGYGTAAVIAGAAYDHFGSYRELLGGLIVIVSIAVLLSFSLRPPVHAAEPAMTAG